MKNLIVFIFLFYSGIQLNAENGHSLWLRNKKSLTVNVISSKNTATLKIAKNELLQSWKGKPGATIALVIKPEKAIKGDGFKLTQNSVQANTELGILYGVYELLRRQQTDQSIFDDVCNPSYEFRILNHWDNLDGSIERGYAGQSIFWHKDNPFDISENDKCFLPII